MSELQEISVVIDAAGNIRIKVHGVKGGKCRDLTRDLECVLGNQVLEREHTDEYTELPLEEHEQDWVGQN